MHHQSRAHAAVRAPLLAVSIAAACLLVPACSPQAARHRDRPFPDAATLTASIARYGADLPRFDQLRAVVAATGDRIVFEKYYGTDPDTCWALASVTKSVVSTLVGIALDDGALHSLDEPLDQLLPRYADVMSPAVARTTLRQLLTMTAGFPANSSFLESDDWVRDILTHPDGPPGGRFVYSDAGAHLIAAILRQATGVPVLTYARSRLFDPLGIDTRPAWQARPDVARPQQQLAAYYAADVAWPRDPQGVADGWWGLKLRPRDLVKLGQLYLADGRWHGRQIVSSAWVHQATSEQVGTGGLDGYGFEWWTADDDGHHAFRAMGFGGQLIEVVPDRRLVVVATTRLRQDDPTSQGIDTEALAGVLEEAVMSRFPAR